MKILVTGATGFIGKYLIPLYLGMGHTVIAAGRKTPEERQGLTFVPFDMEAIDPAENYFTYFDSPDMLVHLAWEGLPNYKNDFHLTGNLPRHKCFLENLIMNGLKEITVTGTCLEYGMQDGELNEAMNANPVIAYPKAKLELLHELEKLSAKRGVKLKWLRLFYMFGTGQNPNSLFAQLSKALESGSESFKMSGGEQVRDFLPVDVMVERIARLSVLHNWEGICNVCSGVPVKVIDLVKRIILESGKSIRLETGFYPYPDYEPMEFWGSTSKMNSILK